TVMCSYNRINGVYASENRMLLTRILREQWGFDGLVMSDWGAVYRRPAGVAAGLDLEMPSSGGVTDREIARAGWTRRRWTRCAPGCCAWRWPMRRSAKRRIPRPCTMWRRCAACWTGTTRWPCAPRGRAPCC
ncbi:MAG: glycoside hydrolase family 3 N-terminal domain-containing protein, partial [Ruthenibacterium lactatiformans]